MPRGFAELLVARLPATFCSGFDRTARLEGFVEAVLVGFLAILGIGGFIRVLLRGVTRSGEGCGSAASTPEGNGRSPEDTFCEMFNPRRDCFFFLASFDTFDEWTGPRHTFADCPSFWESFLLVGCPVV